MSELEPVAWRWRLKYQDRDEWTDWQVTASRRDYGGPNARIEEHPLYAHPAPTRAEVLEMRLCEQNHVILKPDQLYRFTVDPNCAGCRALAGEKP